MRFRSWLLLALVLSYLVSRFRDELDPSGELDRRLRDAQAAATELGRQAGAAGRQALVEARRALHPEEAPPRHREAPPEQRAEEDAEARNAEGFLPWAGADRAASAAEPFTFAVPVEGALRVWYAVPNRARAIALGDLAQRLQLATTAVPHSGDGLARFAAGFGVPEAALVEETLQGAGWRLVFAGWGMPGPDAVAAVLRAVRKRRPANSGGRVRFRVSARGQAEVRVVME